MRIERIAVSVLTAPVEDPVPMSFGKLSDRRVCVVEIEAGGAVGIGESWINYPGWAHAERMSTLVEGVAPAALGLDAGDPAEVQRILLDALLPVARQAGAPGPVWQAISGVDLALWDLAGRLAGKPVHVLLGGDRTATRVPAYASGVGPTGVERLCREATALGLRTVKAKIGFGDTVDEATFTSIRSSTPEGTRVLADANQAWQFADAVAAAPMLRAHQVDWIEEPLAGDRLADLDRLAQTIDIPIATGENVYGRGAFEQCVDASGVRWLQPDLAKSGGFTIANAVAAYADGTGTRIAPHCYSSALGLLASAQLAAAWSQVEMVEVDVRPNPLRTDLLDRPLVFTDGALVLPSGPGLGAGLDADVVDDLRTHYQERTL